MYKYTAAPCGAQDVRAVPCGEITRAGANGAGLVMRNVVEPGRLHTDGGRHPHIPGDFPGARRQKICRFEVADKEKCPTMTSAAILAASTARLRAGFKLFWRAVRQPPVQYTATRDAVMFHKSIVQLPGDMAAHSRAKAVFLRSAEKKADSRFAADKRSTATPRCHAASESGSRSEEFQRT